MEPAIGETWAQFKARGGNPGYWLSGEDPSNHVWTLPFANSPGIWAKPSDVMLQRMMPGLLLGGAALAWWLFRR